MSIECCNAARACDGIPETELLTLSRIGSAHGRLIRLGFYADKAAARLEAGQDELDAVSAAVESAVEPLVLREVTPRERAELRRLVTVLQDALNGPVPERSDAGEFAEVRG
jgi:hypothetical protein